MIPSVLRQLLGLSVALAIWGFGLPSSHAECLQSDVQKSPISGGILNLEGKLKIDVARATGNVPYMKAAYNRTRPDTSPPAGEGWYDDSLVPVSFPDDYRGLFPINNAANFTAMPGQSFAVRFYGSWSDGGTLKPFFIHKDCTAVQTAWSFYNGYDHYPNLVIVVTWDRAFPGISKRRLSIERLMKVRRNVHHVNAASGL